MAQTKAGIEKFKATMRTKYGDDFWKKIGAEGGYIGHTGGFSNRELAKSAGIKSGEARRRKKS